MSSMLQPPDSETLSLASHLIRLSPYPGDAIDPPAKRLRADEEQCEAPAPPVETDPEAPMEYLTASSCVFTICDRM
jgi:hypothetical protein